jgi:hypothetical protein
MTAVGFGKKMCVVARIDCCVFVVGVCNTETLSSSLCFCKYESI